VEELATRISFGRWRCLRGFPSIYPYRREYWQSFRALTLAATLLIDRFGVSAQSFVVGIPTPLQISMFGSRH
jgi:hypothetical protein